MKGKVLAATIGCLVERGYANTSTRHIARRAGVTVGALQHHFDSKAELMAAALRELGERIADDFLARADRVALRPGALWSEQHQGTNAIGTAIAARDATMVFGDQHYLRANQFLACSSVPILDPFGELLGVLDVTGDCRGHSRHTMALAKMSAQMIENHLFTSAFPEALRIHFHGRPDHCCV